jgi:hypothetical protein
VIAGNAKCHCCSKGKKECKFLVEEKKEEEEVEEVSAVLKLPITSLKKLIFSPLHSLCKCKENNLSLELQKKKAATLLLAIHTRRESLSPKFADHGDVSSIISMPPPSMLSSRLQGLSMPPPSMISSRLQAPSSSSHLFFPSENYHVCLLQTTLQESEKNLSTVREQFASWESLYLEQIAKLSW